MKRALLALLGTLFSFLAQAQPTDIFVSVSYTSGAAAYAASQGGKTVQQLIDTCMASTNPNYAGNGIPIRILALTSPAGSGAPSDSSPMTMQIRYALNAVQPLQARTNAGASMGIILASPPAGVAAQIPAAPPTLTKDSVAAITTANLCQDLEDAISRMLGTTQTSGYAVRLRRFPYQGENLCYHTRDSSPSAPSVIVPYNSYWRTSNLAASDAGTPETSCEAFRAALVAAGGPGSQQSYYTSQVQTVGSAKYCNLYNQSGSQTSNQGIFFTQAAGGSTIGCGVAGDFMLQQYSSATGNYLGMPIGDSTHNSVAAMNDRIPIVLGLASGNTTLLRKAQDGPWSTIKSVFFD